MSSREIQDLRARRVHPEVRSAPRSLGVTLLTLGGVSLLAAGALIQLGPESFPGAQSLEKIIEFLKPHGFELKLYAFGVLLVGLGILGRDQRRQTSTVLQPSRGDEAWKEVTQEIGQVESMLEDLQAAQIKSSLELGFVRQEIHDYREDSKVNETKDALFRLAASLDQLGARIDQRIGVATAVLQDGLHEVSALVETSREYLQESIEDTTRQLTRPARVPAYEQPPYEAPPAPQHDPAPAPAPAPEVATEPAIAEEVPHKPEPEAQSKTADDGIGPIDGGRESEDDFGGLIDTSGARQEPELLGSVSFDGEPEPELEIEVELEVETSKGSHSSGPESGLGLLDDLGDDGFFVGEDSEPTAPLPREAPWEAPELPKEVD